MVRVFVSLPYGHGDRAIVDERIAIAQEYVMNLLMEGYCPVCPILVGDPLVQRFLIPDTFDKWKDYCLTELASCDIMHVLQIDGWDYSYGIQCEIDRANKLNKEVKYINEKEINK